MEEFAHLHLHTEYSLLDGAAHIESLFEKCVKMNMHYVAITDHGNMYGAYHFYCADKKRRNNLKEKREKLNRSNRKEAESKGLEYIDIPPSYEEEFVVKPIIGCEFYVTDDMNRRSGRVDREFNHLILLAKNNVGYRNLMNLDSLAFTEGFYYKPRIDLSLLAKHTEGLICMSACIAGQIPQLLLDNREADAEKAVEQYKKMFGEDYYIEIQDHGIAEEKYCIPRLVELAKKCNVKLVATNDVHYLNRADAEMHDILLCVQTGKYIDDTDRLKFEGSEFYLKSYQEMLDLFPFAPEAIANTIEIAKQCNVTIQKDETLIPNYIPDNGLSPEDFLYSLMMEGLNEKYPTPLSQEVLSRANYEFDVVKKMKYIEYYLIVWDFIHYSERQGIAVGPGRGSGAGSIIAYAIGITKVEPLRYNLIFERFLNPERKTMPDFDIDFCMDRRGEAIDYVFNKYGKDNVAQIITFGTMACKGAIKDVARVLKIPFADVTKISKLIPDGTKATISQIIGLSKDKDGNDLSIPEVKEIYEQDYQMKKVINLALQLEGSPRHCSTHAAGVVVCRERICDHVPLQKNGEDITTQFNMKEVEELGLLKIDFLGLTNLTDIDKTIRLVKETSGEVIDFSKSNYDDAGVYELISSGDTQAIFQLESGGMTKLMKELCPNCLEDIIAGISLYRPGPMQFIGDYVWGKHNQDKVVYKHPLLENILKNTYGCMVYQEQIMQIVRELAGFSYGEADSIRRAMSKKNADEMSNQREYFVNGKKNEKGELVTKGAVNMGVSKEIANDIFDQMTDFAQYAFNKSHAAGYAYLAYQTAYLKRYYFVEYICSVLNNRTSKVDEIKKYIAYAIEKGVEILVPDINKSSLDFSVESRHIRFGLLGIKSIGRIAIERIIEERNISGEFTSLKDFLTRVDSKALNKRLVENLIKGGAFDCFNVSRAEMMATYEPIMERISNDKKKREIGQFSMFDMLGQDSAFSDVEFGTIKEYGLKYKLSLEKEVLGMCVSGNPLSEYAQRLKEYDFNSSMLFATEQAEDGETTLEQEYDGKKVTLGGNLSDISKTYTKRTNKLLCTAKLEDMTGTISLMMFANSYERNKKYIVEDTMVTVIGTLSVKSEDVPKVFVDKIIPWQDKEEKKVSTALYLRMLKKDNGVYEQISSILQNYEGDFPVILVIGEKKYSMPSTVRQCKGIEYELTNILGQGNVVFAEKKA
ncbi:MAG: DNA polymerase III subunit alpha [Clostridia bacterium]